MNRVFLIGRLTKDAELRCTSNGMNVAKFCIAVKRAKEGSDFVNCVAFDKIAEVISKHVKKGIKIALEGHIQTGSYKDKDKKKIYTTDVIVERMEFVDKKEEKKEEKNAKNFDEEFNQACEEMNKEVQAEQYNLPF